MADINLNIDANTNEASKKIKELKKQLTELNAQTAKTSGVISNKQIGAVAPAPVKTSVSGAAIPTSVAASVVATKMINPPKMSKEMVNELLSPIPGIDKLIPQMPKDIQEKIAESDKIDEKLEKLHKAQDAAFKDLTRKAKSKEGLSEYEAGILAESFAFEDELKNNIKKSKGTKIPPKAMSMDIFGDISKGSENLFNNFKKLPTAFKTISTNFANNIKNILPNILKNIKEFTNSLKTGISYILKKTSSVFKFASIGAGMSIGLATLISSFQTKFSSFLSDFSKNFTGLYDFAVKETAQAYQNFRNSFISSLQKSMISAIPMEDFTKFLENLLPLYKAESEKTGKPIDEEKLLKTLNDFLSKFTLAEGQQNPEAIGRLFEISMGKGIDPQQFLAVFGNFNDTVRISTDEFANTMSRLTSKLESTGFSMEQIFAIFETLKKSGITNARTMVQYVDDFINALSGLGIEGASENLKNFLAETPNFQKIYEENVEKYKKLLSPESRENVLKSFEQTATLRRQTPEGRIITAETSAANMMKAQILKMSDQIINANTLAYSKVSNLLESGNINKIMLASTMVDMQTGQITTIGRVMAPFLEYLIGLLEVGKESAGILSKVLDGVESVNRTLTGITDKSVKNATNPKNMQPIRVLW